MKSLVAFVFAWCGCAAMANDVVVMVTEVTLIRDATSGWEKKDVMKPFLVSLSDFTSKSFTGTHGNPIPQTTKFAIKRAKSELKAALGSADLCEGEQHLVPALTILYQCKVGETDIVIVEREHNSFITPLHWMTAMAGHPIQVSVIWAIILEPNKSAREVRLLSKSSASGWKSTVFETKQ